MTEIETVYTTIYRKKKSFAGVIRIGIKIVTTMIDGKPKLYTRILNVTTIMNRDIMKEGSGKKSVIHSYPEFRKEITQKLKPTRTKEPEII